MTAAETTVLWRPVGPEELELIRLSGWREWPPRLPGQPFFYPVLNEEYAIKIARDWNVPASGAGYVTAFEGAAPGGVKQKRLARTGPTSPSC